MLRHLRKQILKNLHLGSRTFLQAAGNLMKHREITEQCLLQETQLMLNGNMMSFIRKHAAVHHKQLLKATKSATVWKSL